MTNQTSVNCAVSALPNPVLIELSRTGADPAHFCRVIEAFGPLPSDMQLELVNRLIEARGRYIAQCMWKCDSAARPGVCQKRLKEIGSTASRLRRLLHRDGALSDTWNLHPAATL